MTTSCRLGLLVCVVPFVTGCYNGCESSSGARQQMIAQEREAFVFRAPREEVFAELRQLLAEEGHSLPPDASPTDRTIETDWKPAASGARSRFVVHLIELREGKLFGDGGGFLVHIVGILENSEGVVVSRLRWTDLEWELIQRVDPDRAVEILGRANRRGDEVHRRKERGGL